MDVPITLSAVVPLVFPSGNPVMDMLGSPEVMGFLKTSGIFTGVAGLIFVVVKFKLVELVSIENETVALRQSWGKVKHYNPRLSRTVDRLLRSTVLATPAMRFAIGHSERLRKRLARAGRVVVLHPGAHEVFRGMHNLILVSLREVVLEGEKSKMTYCGRTLEYQVIAVLQVAYDGTPWGEENLVKSVFSVRDTNIHDGDIGVLRDKFRAILGRATAAIQATAPADEQGFPVLELESYKEEAETEILELHGYYLRKLYIPPMAWVGEQIEKDGKIRAAEIEADAKVQAATILARAIAEQQVPTPGPFSIAGVTELTDTA
jgi:hypothetical protein